MSKGSLHESLNHLIDARDQRIITEDELLIEEHHIRKAIDTVTGLIRHLEMSKEPDHNQRRRLHQDPGQNPNPTEPDPEDGTSNP